MLAVVNYPLANGGFESPNLSETNSYYAGVQGWLPVAGVGTTYEVISSEPSPAPEGEQYAYGDSNNWTLAQYGPTIAANTRYILSVDLFPLSTGTSRATVTLQDDRFAQLDSASFHPTWNPTLEDFVLPDGQWTTVKIGWNSFENPTSVGRDLLILINGSRLAVDNVTLTIDDSVHDFYVSSSSGSDTNDGFSSGAAMQDFSSLAPYFPLMPGERILLKAGDTFTEELNIRGKGTAGLPVELTSYGAGPNPVIQRQDVANDVGVIWNNASYANISNIDVEHSKLGIYLRYEWEDVGSRDVTIENCNFRDMPDPTLDPSDHNYEYAWSDAIWVGGQAWNQAEQATRLENLTIRNVTADNVAHLFGTGWYYPTPYYSRVVNLIIEDCIATNCLCGSFQLFGVDGGHIKRVKAIVGGGEDTWAGVILGLIQNSRNFLIEDCEFSYTDRAHSADGGGMDFEGDTHNVVFRNNVIHHNDAGAVAILSSGGPHTNLQIYDNTFYNNGLNPWSSGHGEIFLGGVGHTGSITNNGIYRGSADIDFFSSGDWSGFVRSGNRLLDYYSVSQRDRWWDFDTNGDFDGWAGFNQWSNAAVVGGTLTGQSSGADPYVHSAPTFVNSNLMSYTWVRMSQTAGTFAQLFYITETDPVWNEAKSVHFAITPDGGMHDYFVDIGSLVGTSGVITQVRLDPTNAGGSDMAIDFVRLTDSTNPNQVPPSDPLPAPQEMVFTSVASHDGYITESSQNSGVGGTVNSNGTTFRIGDDSSNRAYRPILSFDTSLLPDNASIVEVTLGITRVGSLVGTIPIGVADPVFGEVFVDLATPSLGTPSLTASDWESPVTKDVVSKFAWPAYEEGMTLFSRLENPDNDLVNLGGYTQFRIRYEHDDDNDNSADYSSYASGNHSNLAYRPTLTVKYYINDNPSADFDSSDEVDGRDFLIWQRNVGKYGGALQSDGDANTDTDVDGDDFVVWQSQYGTSPAVVETLAQLEEQTQLASVVVASVQSPALVEPNSTDFQLSADLFSETHLKHSELAVEELARPKTDGDQPSSLPTLPARDIAQFKLWCDNLAFKQVKDGIESYSPLVEQKLVDDFFDETFSNDIAVEASFDQPILAEIEKASDDEQVITELDDFFAQIDLPLD